MGPSAGSDVGGGSSEIQPGFENVRMALVMTLQHKYIQLSGNNHALLIRSRIGVVMMLAFELRPSTIVDSILQIH